MGFLLVFIEEKRASQVIRAKRANTPFEELKRGNLERECVEEICDHEEAREVFEANDKTVGTAVVSENYADVLLFNPNITLLFTNLPFSCSRVQINIIKRISVHLLKNRLFFTL